MNFHWTLDNHHRCRSVYLLQESEVYWDATASKIDWVTLTGIKMPQGLISWGFVCLFVWVPLSYNAVAGLTPESSMSTHWWSGVRIRARVWNHELPIGIRSSFFVGWIHLADPSRRHAPSWVLSMWQHQTVWVDQELIRTGALLHDYLKALVFTQHFVHVQTLCETDLRKEPVVETASLCP